MSVATKGDVDDDGDAAIECAIHINRLVRELRISLQTSYSLIRLAIPVS